MRKTVTMYIALIFISVVFLIGCTNTQTSNESDVKNTNPDENTDNNNSNDDDSTDNFCYWDWESTRVDHVGEYNEYIGYPYEAKTDFDFLIITLKIVNNADREVSTNPWFWELNADGISYNHHMATYDESIGQTTVDVEKGGDFTTKMVFEVPETVSDATLEYVPIGLSPKMLFDDSLL